MRVAGEGRMEGTMSWRVNNEIVDHRSWEMQPDGYVRDPISGYYIRKSGEANLR